ncbi:MAG TPA: DegT/DnrJ/EryC1/StrS family aminotransferase [Jatrophihabitans sp.]|nr:DegT/DnrJ/EryC1/StrS family aminotransferase [Jatrophihabitans sp.]
MTATEPTIPAARIVFDEDDRRQIAELVDAALRTGQLTLGPQTRAFEQLFAELHAAPHAVAVSSGTAALEIVLRAVGVAGRDVIVPANTFAATTYAVQAAGARPVFADIEPSTLAMSPQTVEAAVTANTAAVVMVHIGGLISPSTPQLAAWCRDRGITLVEDAAHAHGSTLDGRSAGSFGIAGSFSFYPTKVITSGEGGMIVTADDRIRDEALIYRDQGKAGFTDPRHIRPGYAWRISELHAAVGLVQLRRLEQFLAVRRRVAARYDAGLVEVSGLTPLPAAARSNSNYYKYLAVLDDGIDRAQFKARVAEAGVRLSGEVYDRPLHQQPVFADLGTGPLPVAEHLCDRHVCLPVHSDMSDAEADRVLAAVAAALACR